MSVCCRSDHGAASLYVVAAASVVWFAGLAAMVTGQALTVRHQAAAAADLAALAAADHVLDGPAGACRHAHSIAAANRADVVSCALDGEIADVVVQVSTPALGPVRGLMPITARARAGPTTADDADVGPAGP